MHRLPIILLCLALAWTACQRPSPCESQPQLQGQALRFLPLSPLQVQAWMADSALVDAMNLVKDEASFERWTQLQAPELAGRVDFEREIVTLSGMSNVACTACAPIDVQFDSERAWILIEISPYSDGDCLSELEEASFRPNGLLVMRKPSFAIQQIQTKIKSQRW